MIAKIVKILLGGLIALAGLVWLGLRVAARPFPIASLTSRDLGTKPIPSDLPAPVARFARAIFNGDQMPIVESALLVGRARVNFNGLKLWARFKFSHLTPDNYYHFIQATWFALPVATINERYLDGKGIMDIPGIHVEDDPNTNHAANQGFWSEALAWAPSILFADPRVRWEAVDDLTARLILPNASDEEHFTVHFDPQTGLMAEMTTLRYQDPTPAPRLRWTNRTLKWDTFNAVRVPVRSQTQWANNPPWAEWEIEQVLYNVPVTNRLRQFGGEYPEG